MVSGNTLSIKKIEESTQVLDYINWTILNELIQMELDSDDEDEDSQTQANSSSPIISDLSENTFSRELLLQLKEQCTETFNKIEDLINSKTNLKEISSLGHFLKGSSSALGLPRIAYYCELIQNIALKKELTKALKLGGSNTIKNINEEDLYNALNDELIYQFLKNSLDSAKLEFNDTFVVLNKFYKNTL
ncbi:hypothetical protein FOG48_03502 [Hanseniaspora uvarum]|nr:hypothetical protein FOG48_03502 [Hanseniaspora uvarum]